MFLNYFLKFAFFSDEDALSDDSNDSNYEKVENATGKLIFICDILF